MLGIRSFYSINNIAFGKKNHKKKIGKRGYTREERELRHEINTAAINLGWRDIYTGNKFSKQNPSSVEHIIPFSLRKIYPLPEDFQINGLDNFFPAGSKGNNLRANERFSVTVSKQPIILERLLAELKNYENYKSGTIDGKDWVKRLTSTIYKELEGICSDILTHEIKFMDPTNILK